jgi:hypothetical protein
LISSTNKENNMTSTAENSKGYLVCEKCKGRYELQDGESPNDFESCECGGSLKYFENEEHLTESNDLNAKLDNSNLEKSNVSIEAENSDEIIRDRIVELLNTGTLQRNSNLKELPKQKNVEYEILRDIKEDDWALRDLLEKKSVQIDAKDQKILLNEVVNQEEKFSMLIEKQNKKAEQSNDNSILKNGWIYITVFFAIVFVIFFMMLNKA